MATATSRPKSPMRALLDGVYRASGAAAALSLVAICVIVLLQVGANLVDAIAKAAGYEPPGLLVPSYAEFAGFFLAAASFLALAYTLRAGGHIRVELLVHRLGRRARHVFEVWCLALGTAVTAYFSWYAIGLVLESLEFGDLSPGIVPVPLWIPQAAMALGLGILTIAFVDDLIEVICGRGPSYARTPAVGAASNE